jgi:CheY-like chemotaxis protein
MKLLHGVYVLVVDDNEDARDVMRLGLQYDGAAVDVAATASEAMAKMATRHPDVILTDMKMPHTAGDVFLAQLRASPALRGIPVIAVTGVTDDVRPWGFAEYFVKPVDPDELSAAIVRVVSSRPKHQ